MKFDFVQGVADKSAAGLRSILMAQAKLRAAFVLIVVSTEILALWMQSGTVPVRFAYLAVAYAAYALSPIVMHRYSGVANLRRMLVATAISDPLMLTIWIIFSGKFGILIAGFYLFTTLGFGFRTGRRLMYLSQFTSVCAFILILATTPYWQEHVVVWIALLVPLVVVPIYAGALIETLRRAREHAEQQSRAKSELLAKVSHELRTPLTGIMATAELLALDGNDRRVQRRADTILSLSDNLLGEINDLLDQAKYESTGLRLAPSPMDLRESLDGLRRTFEPMARRKNLVLRSTIDAALTSRVNADAHHLNRVLFNLAGNAIKFTEKGEVRISIEILDEQPDRYRLRFEVKDTGIGIPESFQPEMFQPFTQAHESSHLRFGGTGLGLSLTKHIIEAMGSALCYESSPGHGSRFWFDLELDRNGMLATDEGTAVAGSVSAPRRVLLVEDNRTSAALIEELLTLDHHAVRVCDSGIAALELLARESFDVLLLDYNLGDMDGTQVLRTYRFGRPQPAPAIFLTADATAQTAARLMEAGAAGVVHKPLNRAKLREALARLPLPGTAPMQATMPVLPTAAAATSAEVTRLERPALRVVPVSPLDETVLDELRNMGSAPAFFRKLLAQAEVDITRACKQLDDAFANRSLAVVPSVAHALKGVCANVGAIRLSNLAGALLQMPSDELESSGDRLAADLRECADLTVTALRRLVSAGTANSSGNTGTLHLD
ncbi:MAG: response regulator [Proteobacteria bacterium]|nr:response regulator [Pseudomonadota bacterium]